MIYNLKKTKTTEAETLKHLLTVLFIIFEDKEQYLNQQRYDKALASMQEAEKYTKRYLKELIKQNK